MDIRPNHTIYVNRLNEKVKKEGEHGLMCSTLCLKKYISDIFDCNFKTNYQIFITLVRIFLTQLAIK